MDGRKKMERILKWHARRPGICLRNEIVKYYYLNLIQPEAARLHRRLPSSVERSDLECDGVFGLIEAIDGFDPRKASFQTYAQLKVRGAMLDGLRSRDPISRPSQSAIRSMEFAVNKIRVSTGVNPTPQETAQAMGLSLKCFARVSMKAREATTKSLSGHRFREGCTAEESGLLSADLLYDTRLPDPKREVESRVLRDEIAVGLSRSERLIVTLYYYEQMTMKEIGATLDLSESRVSQMHKSILARLKARISEDQLVA